MDPLISAVAGIPRYAYVAVLLATAIDATGLPFPGRVLLIAAGAMAKGGAEALAIIAFGAFGALIGDHVLYSAGRLGRERLLSVFCRVSLGSGRCIEKTQAVLQRFGAFSIILGRFLAGVRIFAAPMAGSGAIPYWRFLAYDLAGAVLWSGTFVLLGYVLGDRWGSLVDRFGGRTLTIAFIALGLGAFGATLAFRLWRRGRHGTASAWTNAASRRGEARTRPS